MSKVEEGGGGFRLTPPPSRLRITIFSRRLLGLKDRVKEHLRQIADKIQRLDQVQVRPLRAVASVRQGGQMPPLNFGPEAN